MDCNKTGKPWADDNCGSCGFNGDCEAQQPTPSAGFTGSICDLKRGETIVSANYDECEKAGIDPKDIERIAKGIERYARQAQKIGVHIFGGSGSETLRIHDDPTAGSRPLILGDINAGHFDGGCGASCEDDAGLLRGE